MPKDLYTLKEVTKETGISPARLKRMMGKGIITGRKIGWIWVFDKAEVELLKAQK